MGDRLTQEQRSALMSRVRSFDTAPERIFRSALHQRGLRFRKHVASLPGRPDVVFSSARVAVFVDGRFWHGYRLPRWKAALPPFWQEKIEKNRRRDRRNFARLRRAGWIVIRIWDHDLDRRLGACVDRVVTALARAR